MNFPWLRQRTRRPLRARPALLALEDRTLPAITLSGVPGWLSVGPEPITFGNNVELNVGGNGITAEDVQVGAADSIAVAPNQKTVYLGTVNGGVWKTDDITDLAANPWQPLTDTLGSLSIGSVALSPADPNTVFAGTGRFSSAGLTGGPRIGLLRSSDGGSTWTVVGAGMYAGNSIHSVVPTGIATPTGHVVLVSTSGGLVFRSVADGDDPAQLSGQPAAFDGLDNNNDGTVDEPGEKNLPSSASDSSLIASPVANQFYLGLGGQGVFRSDNGGVSWQRVDNNGPTPIANIDSNNGRIVLTAPAGNTVYAAVIRNGTLDAVWRSDDNGGSWRKIDNQLAGAVFQDDEAQGNLHFSILADPAHPDVFYIAGDTIPGGLPSAILSDQVTGRNPANIYRVDTINGQDVWEKIVADGAVGTSPHPDSRAMAFLGDTILEADDGGIYALLFPGGPANIRRWESRIGNLRDTEVSNAAFDTDRNTYLAGSQDNAAFEQEAPGDLPWQSTVGGDGGIVQVQTASLGNNETSIHYSSSQELGGFKRRIFNGNDPVTVELIKLKVSGTSGDLDLFQVEQNTAGAGNDTTVGFVNPYVLNAVDPNRMLIGTNYLYESTNPDRGDTLTAVGGLDASLTKLDPAGNLGSAVTAMAYGGRTGGVANAELMYVGTQDVFDGMGNLTVAGQVFIRTSGSGLPTARAAYKAAGGAGVQDLVIDPDDGDTAYVLDRTGRVWQTTNAGGAWTEVTFNLPGLSGDLRTIELFDQDPGGGNSPKVLLVGGSGGVFRMLPPPPDCPTLRWSQYGTDLPHALVMDLDYYGGNADRLVAATFGRGVWTIPSVSTSITTLGTLQVTGDGGPNAMELRQDPGNPGRIVVTDGLGNAQSFDRALFSAVSFQGLGGADAIRIDSNGAAAAGGDINFVTFHVAVDGGGQAGDSLFVEDFDNLVTDLVTVTAGSVGDGVGDSFFGPCGELTYAGLGSLTLDLSDSSIPNDLVNVRGTSAATLIKGNGGIDIFNVSSDAPIDGGSLSTVQGPLTLNGDNGLNVAKFSNFGGPAGVGTLTATQLTGFGMAGITYADLSALDIELSNDAVNGDTLNVRSTKTGGATNIFANAGNDVINVGDAANKLDGIAGFLSIDAGAGTANRLILNDSGGGANPNVVVTATKITGFAPNPISYSAAGGSFTDGAAGDGILLRGSNTAADNIRVEGIPAGSTLKAEGNGGTDLLAVIGPVGGTTLWDLTGLGSGTASGGITFTGMESLKGGANEDVFRFEAGGSLTGSIDGAGGGDWLDYRAKAVVVGVNLVTHKASYTHGVFNIRNVMGSHVGRNSLTGSSQGGVFVGYGAGNMLVSGGGFSVLIGGYGKSLILGGHGNNLEVAGRTVYDGSTTDLDRILAEWSRPISYGQRVADLRAGAGLAGGSRLVVGQTVFLAPVPGGLGPRFGRGGGNRGSTLVGGSPGLDWFFVTYAQQIVDPRRGVEYIN